MCYHKSNKQFSLREGSEPFERMVLCTGSHKLNWSPGTRKSGIAFLCAFIVFCDLVYRVIYIT